MWRPIGKKFGMHFLPSFLYHNGMVEKWGRKSACHLTTHPPSHQAAPDGVAMEFSGHTGRVT